MKKLKIAIGELYDPWHKGLWRHLYYRPYMSGSQMTAAAMLHAMGHDIRVFDLNTQGYTRATKRLIMECDVAGVSVTGSPSVPDALEFARKLKRVRPDMPFMTGGQVIAGFKEDQFDRIFTGTNAVQIKDNTNIAKVLNCLPSEVPNWWTAPIHPVWEKMDQRLLLLYLIHEMTLVLSQGCHHKCLFCAAEWGMREQFKDLNCFTADLRYLANRAKEFRLTKLEFYASSLDFFQNPDTIPLYLEAIAKVRRDTGIDVRIRCLSCIGSFIRAHECISGLKLLLKAAGVHTVGLGVDGNMLIWVQIGKPHNSEKDLEVAIQLAHEDELVLEALMVMGHREDDLNSIARTDELSERIASPTVPLRPHCGKFAVPGNQHWDDPTNREEVEAFVSHPERFRFLDFRMEHSVYTDPDPEHREMCNQFYRGLIKRYRKSGLCLTARLLPEIGLMKPVAYIRNRCMPPDR